MTVDCAVCYVSNLNFLLPSLVSAAGARAFIPPHKADIFIFTAEVDPAQTAEIDRFAQPYSIRVQAMDENVFRRIDRTKFIRPDTPMAMFGRFFLHEFLPSSCRRIVYIDGDTWIRRDPSPLIDAQVPAGRFAAADDNIWLRQKLGFGATVHKTRQYFRKLGLKPENGYFNTGVFAAARDTWKNIAREAYEFYLAHPEDCQFSQDQCALNAVAGGRRLRLSNKWNFQTQFKFWGADRFIEPHIYHFNRWPKPWMGACAPWEEFFPQYEKAIAPFASLNLPIKKLSAGQAPEINASTRKTYGYLRWPLVSQMALAGMGFGKLEKQSWL